MHIVIIQRSVLPVLKYGGTERVIWYLAKELVKLGHKVTFMASKGSVCNFADVIPIEEDDNISELLPKNADIIHLHDTRIKGFDNLSIPKVVTIHGNPPSDEKIDVNSIFVSENHARLYGSNSFVYNGLDWNDYGEANLKAEKKFFHFLGNGAWRVKNLQGAIDLVKGLHDEKLYVFGGVRFNFNMGIRLTFTPKARFFGFIDNETKKKYLPHSKGLIFPVLWNEPFGLALIESLYFGNPVFGTPYGSLPEIILPEVGFLSNSRQALKEAMSRWQDYDPKICHQYAQEKFNSQQMALAYLEKYEHVLDGEQLNSSPLKLAKQPPKFLEWKD